MPRESQSPPDVAAIRAALEEVLEKKDSSDRVPANAKFGVYAFYDYDGEPIYVGQTTERLRTRIRRHLTNQRTDAVAMNVLDPFEVAEIEMWPFYQLEGEPARDPAVKSLLDAAESTVFQRALAASQFDAVLNERIPPKHAAIDLPPSLRASIIPPDLRVIRRHADTRIARRAATIASLARVISERRVSAGLRQTLLTQATRLEALAEARLRELGIPDPRGPSDGEGEGDG